MKIITWNINRFDGYGTGMKKRKIKIPNIEKKWQKQSLDIWLN